MSPLLRAYLAFSAISGPLWRAVHRRRLARGKEIPARLPEKYGRYTGPRPDGTLLWFHALSIGESFALLPLIERALADLPDAQAILTTSTASSIEALEGAKLPARCQHILLPIDTKAATRAFLTHWRPDLAAFAELDFWPRLMVETHRAGVPMILVNSRVPDASFTSRKKLGGMMRDVLRLFDALLVQDDLSRDRFAQLGADPARIQVLGALKAAARPLPADTGELERLEIAIGPRPVWLAAATEAQEHAAMLAAHEVIRDALPDALMILAPRFKEDAASIIAMATPRFTVAQRSEHQPLTPETDLYIADTFGEMGLWYRLAPVSFIGHSLGHGLSGKNPYEAAALGSAILYGPEISYFSESYAALDAASAARRVTSAEDLAAAVRDLQDPDLRAAMRGAADGVIEDRRAVLSRTWDVLKAAL